MKKTTAEALLLEPPLRHELAACIKASEAAEA